MQVLTDAAPERIRALIGSGEFFWLDLDDPDGEGADAVAGALGLGAGARTREFEFGDPPQLRRYNGYVALVFYAVDPAPAGGARDPDAGMVEVHLLVSGDWIVTIRRAPCPALDRLRSDLAEQRTFTEQSLVAELLDALADTFTDRLEPLDERIGQLEEAAAGEVPSSEERTLRRQILRGRNALLPLRRIVRRQRDYVDRALDELSDLPGLDPSQHHDLRDVAGQMIRTSDRIDDALDRLTSALDLLNSTVSNRLNEVMKRLTVVATIFLPLTVVTGFFGQNFKWLTDHIEGFASFAVLGIALLVVSGVGVGMWVSAKLEHGGDAG